MRDSSVSVCGDVHHGLRRKLSLALIAFRSVWECQ
jgi:hypothetical protein